MDVTQGRHRVLKVPYSGPYLLCRRCSDLSSDRAYLCVSTQAMMSNSRLLHSALYSRANRGDSWLALSLDSDVTKHHQSQQ